METQSASNHQNIRRSYIYIFFQLWAVCYSFLYILTSQYSLSFRFLEPLVKWFGKNILDLPEFHRILVTGSGDTVYHYVLLAFLIVLSVFVALVLCIALRRRKNFGELYLFAIVIARYFVAIAMIGYGFAKIFDGQFPELDYYNLEKKLGDSSPMGIAWAFMRSSQSYTFIAGLLELIGGVLLLWRRTATFGALFSLTVMINVALFNYNYDVPVKIFSTHLVLFCLFILSLELKILYNFFILHQTTRLNYNLYQPQKRWKLITTRVVKYGFIIWLIATNVNRLWPTITIKEASPIEGAYIIEKYLNQDSNTNNTLDSTKWNKILVMSNKYITIQTLNKKLIWLESYTDTDKKEINIYKEYKKIGMLNYNIQGDTAYFKGKIDDKLINIKSIRKNKKDYPLVNRGFHWVNDYPPNW